MTPARHYAAAAVATLPDGDFICADTIMRRGDRFGLFRYDSDSGQYLQLHTYGSEAEAERHFELMGGERPIEEVARYYH